jgi:subtilisin family serine protease
MRSFPFASRQLPPILLCVLAAALALGAAGRPAVASSGGHHRPGQVVVRLDPAAGASIAAVSADVGATPVEALDDGEPTYLLDVPPGADAAALSAALNDDPRVAYAEPNFISQPPEALPRNIGAWGGLDAAPMAVQPATDQIRLYEALARSRGDGVTVAVIDTGVQLDHPYLAEALAPGYDFVDDDATPEDVADGVDDDGDGQADEAFGHGTHVSGIVHLVAPGARLMPLRVLNADGQGDIFTVAQAIRHAADHGADVINLSLGTASPSFLLADATRYAARRGALLLAAAGNGASAAPQYPAANACVLAVTSLDAAGARSSFGNYGSWVDLAAPGESVFSAFPPGGFAWATGTSMAAPFAAGQAALVRAANPGLGVRRVAGAMVGSARWSDAAADSGPVRRIDLEASLRLADEGPITPFLPWRCSPFEN